MQSTGMIISRARKLASTSILGLAIFAAAAVAMIYLSGYAIYLDLGSGGGMPGGPATPPTREPGATATASPAAATATLTPALATATPEPAAPTATAQPATPQPSATATPRALDTSGPPFRLLIDGAAVELSWAGVRALLSDGGLAADRAALAEFARAFAAGHNRAAQRAAFHWNDASGSPELVQESRAGLAVREAALVEALAAALEGGRGRDIEVPVEVIAPEWSAGDPPLLGDEIIGEGKIYYAGSDPATVQNVEQGALALDGAISLPGLVFSHDAWVYDGRGYAASYAIAGDRTVLAPGGGLCILSTALFQTAFWAGLPIVERHNHDYWIAMYAMEVGGQVYKGLDATVGDVRFRNTTGAPLRVKSWTEDGWLHVRLIGTRLDWQVRVRDYAITNYQPAYDTVEYFDEPGLPRGTTEVSRNPHDGFDATLTREVLRDGVVIDTYKAVSRYIATGKQVMVGTGE